MVDVELWDLAAAGGAGAKIGSAEVALDLAEYEPFASQAATVQVIGRDNQVRVHPFHRELPCYGSSS